MPAKWQQWMPFRIDAFKSSPAVRAMHPSARIGYLYLLAYAWQTDDCTIPDDPIQLAEISEIGDELWSIHSARILRKFEAVTARSPSENGTVTAKRLRNETCYAEWKEAQRVFIARREAANRTNTARSPSENGTVTARGPSRSADTRTETGTVIQKTPLTPLAGGRRRKRFEPGVNGQPPPTEDEAYEVWLAMPEAFKKRNPWNRGAVT